METHPRFGSSSEPSSATAIMNDLTTKASSPDSPLRSKMHLFRRTSYASLPDPEEKGEMLEQMGVFGHD